MRSLASLLAVLVLTACGAGSAPAGGTWHIESDPTPPVAGSAAGLFLEYVPMAGEGSADPMAGLSTIRATCASCGGLTVEVKAEPYPSLAAEEVYHPGATAGYSARITLPRAGEWEIAPFGRTITVRPVDDFEPPLIHVNRWSDPLDPGCGRREVAALVNAFVEAYNVGDSARLGVMVQDAINFSIAGGAVPFIAGGRATLMAGVAPRHAAGERLSVTRVHIARTNGVAVPPPAVEMAIYGTRTASDLPRGGQRLGGKAAMSCSEKQFIHLNLGVFL